jgi:predicted metal-dependent peptidase|tara:strand:+ start:14361 stop:15653 length:1293 start_codon:yes stop_codon:yes gene_type:complete
MINADIEMKKAKTKIISKHSGWATIVIPLNLVKTDEVEVMATNGKSIFYNPTAIEKWFEENGRRKGQDFIQTVILHEVLHVGWQHCFRKGNREHELWNIATDLVINYHLSGISNSDMTTSYDHCLQHLGGLSIFDYREWLDSKRDLNSYGAEELYSILQKNQDEDTQKNNGGGYHNPQGDEITGHKTLGGEVQEYEGSEEEKQKVSQNISERIIQSHQVQKKVGGGSDFQSIEKARQGQKKPLDWREVLRDKIANQVQSDYQSYARPSRRFLANGDYLPSNVPTPSLSLAIGIDISGSVGLEERQQFNSEIQRIAEDFQIERVLIAYINETTVCLDKSKSDTDLTRFWDCFEYGEEIETRDFMNGGTEFKPFFNLIERTGEDENISCAIYFTDCYAYDLEEEDEPNYPVIWATTSAKPPVNWGEEVRIID